MIHAGILLSFALIPLWYRLPEVPPLLPPLYISRFALLLPMLATILGWLLTGLPGFATLRRDPARRLWALSVLLLVLWSFASQLWAFQAVPHPEVGATAALQFGIVALFALVVACEAPSGSAIMAVLIVSLLWNSLIAGGQVAQQAAIGLIQLGEFPIHVLWPGVSVVEAGDLRWLRPYGLLPHPNVLAGVLALGLLACGLWILSPRRWQWIAGTTAAMVGLWVFGLTFSRGAWLGFVLGGLVMITLVWRTRLQLHWMRLFISAAFLLNTGLMFFAVYQPLLLARSGVGAESIEQRSVSDRLVYTEFALRAVAEHPITGVGVGNFPWQASYYLMFTDFDLLGDNVHNIYLSVWAELGTVGLALYLLALGSGLWAALRRPPMLSRLIGISAVVTLLVIGLLDHYPYTLLHFQTALWGLLALSGAHSADDTVGAAISSRGKSPQVPALNTTSERTHKS